MAQSVIGNLVIQMSANSAALTESFNRTKAQSRSWASSQRKQTSLVADAFSSLRGVIGGLAAAFSVRQFVQAADTMRNLRSQIRLVTDSAEDLARVQSRLFQISQQTFTGFDAVTNLYTRLARATSSLGTSQEDLFKVTASITNAFRVSGASAAEASNAITQLSQGLAAGALRGDEFNSVAEQAPRLMQAVADSLGVNVGQLRAMAAEGKITADIIVTALVGAFAQLQREAEQLEPTVGAALTRLGNSALLLADRYSMVLGASKGLVTVFDTLATAMEALATDGLNRLKGGFEGLFSILSELSNQVVGRATKVWAFWRYVVIRQIEGVKQAWIRFKGLFSDRDNEIAASNERIANAFREMNATFAEANAQMEQTSRNESAIRDQALAWAEYASRLEDTLPKQAKATTEVQRTTKALKDAKKAMDALSGSAGKAEGSTGAARAAGRVAATGNAFVRRGKGGEALGVGFDFGGETFRFGRRARGGPEVEGSIADLVKFAGRLASTDPSKRTAVDDQLLNRITEAIQLGLQADRDVERRKKEAEFVAEAGRFLEQKAKDLGGTEKTLPTLTQMADVLMKIERNTGGGARAG